MIAVLSPLVARCLSRQFADTFSVPSSNHLIDTSGLLKLTFFTCVKGLIQLMFCAFLLQKPS